MLVNGRLYIPIVGRWSILRHTLMFSDGRPPVAREAQAGSVPEIAVVEEAVPTWSCPRCNAVNFQTENWPVCLSCGTARFAPPPTNGGNTQNPVVAFAVEPLAWHEIVLGIISLPIVLLTLVVALSGEFWWDNKVLFRDTYPAKPLAGLSRTIRQYTFLGLCPPTILVKRALQIMILPVAFVGFLLHRFRLVRWQWYNCWYWCCCINIRAMVPRDADDAARHMSVFQLALHGILEGLGRVLFSPMAALGQLRMSFAVGWMRFVVPTTRLTATLAPLDAPQGYWDLVYVGIMTTIHVIELPLATMSLFFDASGAREVLLMRVFLSGAEAALPLEVAAAPAIRTFDSHAWRGLIGLLFAPFECLGIIEIYVGPRFARAVGWTWRQADPAADPYAEFTAPRFGQEGVLLVAEALLVPLALVSLACDQYGLGYSVLRPRSAPIHRSSLQTPFVHAGEAGGVATDYRTFGSRSRDVERDAGRPTASSPIPSPHRTWPPVRTIWEHIGRAASRVLFVPFALVGRALEPYGLGAFLPNVILDDEWIFDTSQYYWNLVALGALAVVKFLLLPLCCLGALHALMTRSAKPQPFFVHVIRSPAAWATATSLLIHRAFLSSDEYADSPEGFGTHLTYVATRSWFLPLTLLGLLSDFAALRLRPAMGLKLIRESTWLDERESIYWNLVLQGAVLPFRIALSPFLLAGVAYATCVDGPADTFWGLAARGVLTPLAAVGAMSDSAASFFGSYLPMAPTVYLASLGGGDRKDDVFWARCVQGVLLVPRFITFPLLVASIIHDLQYPVTVELPPANIDDVGSASRIRHQRGHAPQSRPLRPYWSHVALGLVRWLQLVLVLPCAPFWGVATARFHIGHAVSLAVIGRQATDEIHEANLYFDGYWARSSYGVLRAIELPLMALAAPLVALALIRMSLGRMARFVRDPAMPPRFATFWALARSGLFTALQLPWFVSGLALEMVLLPCNSNSQAGSWPWASETMLGYAVNFPGLSAQGFDFVVRFFFFPLWLTFVFVRRPFDGSPINACGSLDRNRDNRPVLYYAWALMGVPTLIGLPGILIFFVLGWCLQRCDTSSGVNEASEMDYLYYRNSVWGVAHDGLLRCWAVLAAMWSTIAARALRIFRAAETVVVPVVRIGTAAISALVGVVVNTATAVAGAVLGVLGRLVGRD